MPQLIDPWCERLPLRCFLPRAGRGSVHRPLGPELRLLIYSGLLSLCMNILASLYSTVSVLRPVTLGAFVVGVIALYRYGRVLDKVEHRIADDKRFAYRAALVRALAAKGEIQGLTEDDAMSPEDRLKIEDRHYGEPANRCCCVAYLRACTLSVILGILLLLWDTGVIRVGLASVVAAASALAAWYMHSEAMTP